MWARGGAIGDLYQELLDEEVRRHKGFSHRAVEIDASTRENIIVVEDDTGDVYRFGMPGPELSEHEAEALLDAATEGEASFVVASGSLPPGVTGQRYRELGKQVSDLGGRFVLDSSGDALREGVQVGPFMVKPNRKELGQLVGREVSGGDDLAEAGEEVRRRYGVEVVMISLAAEGAMVVDSNGSEHIAAPEVEIKSGVGAGDSTVAGVVLALEREMDLRDAMRYGVAAGAAAVTTPGSQLCGKKTTDKLFEEMKGSVPTQ